MARKLKYTGEIIGKVFGKLTVLTDPRIREDIKWKKPYVDLECICGKIVSRNVLGLFRGETTHCGCSYPKGKDSHAYKTGDSHGGEHYRLYRIWNNVKCRCLTITDKDYKNYGARGVGICKEWLDFSIFKDWALKSGYEDALTIDRIDNNGDYKPDNCQWISLERQSRNRRNNTLITYNNVTKILIEWAEDSVCKVKYSTLKSRLAMGWPFEEALLTPPLPHPKARKK